MEIKVASSKGIGKIEASANEIPREKMKGLVMI